MVAHGKDFALRRNVLYLILGDNVTLGQALQRERLFRRPLLHDLYPAKGALTKSNTECQLTHMNLVAILQNSSPSGQFAREIMLHVLLERA